jgi:hypothetical protein
LQQDPQHEHETGLTVTVSKVVNAWYRIRRHLVDMGVSEELSLNAANLITFALLPQSLAKLEEYLKAACSDVYDHSDLPISIRDHAINADYASAVSNYYALAQEEALIISENIFKKYATAAQGKTTIQPSSNEELQAMHEEALYSLAIAAGIRSGELNTPVIDCLIHEMNRYNQAKSLD